MSLDVQQVAKEFALSEEALTQESLRAFLREQLRTLEAERQARCAKFGVTSLMEMDALLQRRALSRKKTCWRTSNMWIISLLASSE